MITDVAPAWCDEVDASFHNRKRAATRGGFEHPGLFSSPGRYPPDAALIGIMSPFDIVKELPIDSGFPPPRYEIASGNLTHRFDFTCSLGIG